MTYRYLLGDSRREAARLKAQGRLWDPVAHALFDRLRVKPSQKVLEIGPGQGSLHLELRRRVAGPIDAVERSEVFARGLRALCRRDGLGEGRVWNQDLMDVDLPARHYDLIFARWVFLFLPNPEGHVRKLARALRSGGILAIEDYHRDSLAMIPHVPEWQDFMQADRAFFASQGGDVNIGGQLPALFRKCGLELREVTPTILSGHPGSQTWNWLTDYFLGVMDRYARFRPLTPAKARKLRQRWIQASRSPSSLLIAPTVLDVIGRKH